MTATTTQQKKTKRKSNCKCGITTDTGYCVRCSRIRAFIGLKNGNNHLKKPNPTGRLVCPYWYNFYSKNGKSNEYIMEKMLEKIIEKYGTAIQIVTFYNNTGDRSEIKKINF